MKNIVKLGVFLLVVAGIAGLALSYVHGITSPLIEKQDMDKKLNGFKEVYPGAQDIKDESSKYISKDTDQMISEVNVTYKDAKAKGVIYTVKPNGYNGAVKILVGFDINDKKITAIKILDQKETAGLGANCTQSWFTERFKDKNATEPLKVTKKDPVKEDEVMAITAATITSRAVVNGVNAASDHFRNNFLQP